jgi:DNA ligase-1
VLVEHEKAKDRQHVLDKLKEIESLGGEGLMLRKPGSFVLSIQHQLSISELTPMFYLTVCMKVIVRHPCSRSKYVLYSVSLLLCPPNLVDTFAQTFYDAEARVTGYVPGKGRLAGITGALKCEMESGKKFNVGTGLSDKQRRNPPKIGSIITYRFQELTRDGVPRLHSPIRLYQRTTLT